MMSQWKGKHLLCDAHSSESISQIITIYVIILEI